MQCNRTPCNVIKQTYDLIAAPVIALCVRLNRKWEIGIFPPHQCIGMPSMEMQSYVLWCNATLCNAMQWIRNSDYKLKVVVSIYHYGIFILHLFISQLSEQITGDNVEPKKGSCFKTRLLITHTPLHCPKKWPDSVSCWFCQTLRITLGGRTPTTY